MFEFGKREGAPEPQGVTAQRSESRRDSAVAQDAIPPRGAVTVRRQTGEAAVIGPSIRIQGELLGEEDLIIEGEVRGQVRLEDHTVTVGAKGKLEADVYARTIRVEGSVHGDLYASEQISILQSAQVRGNVTAPRVMLQDGAKFKGSIEMDGKAVQSAFGIQAKSLAANRDNPIVHENPMIKPEPATKRENKAGNVQPNKIVSGA